MTSIRYIINISLIASLLIAPLILINQDVFAASWYDSDWTYAKKITINSTQVDSALTDFPLLVNYTSSDVGANAQSDCDDILFTDNTNVTKHKHEIENCDLTTNDWFTAWIKVPSISNTTDTNLFMYYGNSTVASQEDAANTFSDYDMVLHLHDDFLDSTSNNNDGTNNGSTDTACLIADCQSFDRINDRVTVSDATTLTFPDGEWSIAWMMKFDDVTTSNTFQYMYSHDDAGTSPSTNILLLENTTDPDDAQLKLIMLDVGGQGFNSATHTFVTPAFTEAELTSEHMYVIQRESDGDIYLYVDGVEKHSATPNGSFNDVDNTGSLYLGSRNDVSSARMFGGTLDEIRLRDSAYSVDWLESEYANHKAGSTFLTIGNQGTESGGGATSYTRNITDELGLDDSVEVMADITINITDELGLDDSVAIIQDLTINITDELGLDDSTNVIVGLVIPIMDELGLDDSVEVIVSATYVTDELGLDDSVNVSVSQQLFNAIKLYLNTPTETRLGGVLAQTCPSGDYVSGISTNGTIICTTLPP